MRGKPGVPTSMKFYGKIIVYRYEDAWNPEQTETYSEYFQANSIQSAKSETYKNRERTRTLLLDSIVGQRETDIHRKRPPVETLESARLLRAKRRNPYQL